jgi:asparagine synthetase B (glutamine-hydrolysing)
MASQTETYRDPDLNEMKQKRLSIFLSDPKYLAMKTPKNYVYILGLPNAFQKTAPETNLFSDSELTRICMTYKDIAAISVFFAEQTPVMITLWKGLTSSYETFYAARPNGSLIVSDNFPTILSCIPVAERTQSHDLIIDHFVFRRADGRSSYCDQIHRLGHGEKITINLKTGHSNVLLYDSLNDVDFGKLPHDELEKIDSALDETIKGIKLTPKVANLFSGGVDSTLLHSYFKEPVSALYLKKNSYAFTEEQKYAQDAASLLSASLKEVDIETNKFAEQLIDSTRFIGMPPQFLQVVVHINAFRSKFETFVTGERADSLFGMHRRVDNIASYFAFPVAASLLGAISHLIPSSANERWRLTCATARKLSVSPEDPFGFGCQGAVFTDYRLLNSVFEESEIRRRLENCREYLFERVDMIPDADNFTKHSQVFHWMNFFGGEIVMLYRHFANAFGKDIIAPFLKGAVVDAALASPANVRYQKGFEAKYLLKEVLQKRVPLYDAYKKKGYTHIPFDKYYESGPLHNIWEQLNRPNIFDRQAEDKIIQSKGWMAWNLILYAIFCQNVLVQDVGLYTPKSSQFSWTI